MKLYGFTKKGGWQKKVVINSILCALERVCNAVVDLLKALRALLFQLARATFPNLLRPEMALDRSRVRSDLTSELTLHKDRVLVQQLPFRFLALNLAPRYRLLSLPGLDVSTTRTYLVSRDFGFTTRCVSPMVPFAVPCASRRLLFLAGNGRSRQHPLLTRIRR